MSSPSGTIGTHYRYARRGGASTGLLIINISQRPSFWLGSVDMPHPTIDLADRDTGYFVTELAELRAGLRRLIEGEPQGTQICVLGMSKSGFASLHLSRELARTDPARSYGAIVFSPQTHVWPGNRAITFPSYRRMVARAETDAALRAALEDVGDQSTTLKQANLRWLVIYPDKNPRDAAEALAVSGRRVHHEALPMKSHTTIIPYICDTTNAAELQRTVTAMARNATKDADMRNDPINAGEEKMVAELRQLMPRPTLARLIIWFTGVPAEAPAKPVPKPWWRALSTRAWKR